MNWLFHSLEFESDDEVSCFYFLRRRFFVIDLKV
jgi:hypothetical protein